MQKIGVRGFNPFQVIYDCVPQCLVDLTTLPNHTRMHKKTIDFIEDLQHIHKLTHDYLVASATKYKLIADCHRRHVEFAIGDKV